MKVSLFKTYRGVVRARHRTAIFQVMDFCVVAREQPPKKEETQKAKNQSQCLKTCLENKQSDAIKNLTLL